MTLILPKKQLDLGCGDTLRKQEGIEMCFGVDINPPRNKDILYADLSHDPLPFTENMFNLVTAFDFMEHIEHKGMIPLFNEIYRVLKHNGIFHMESPCYPARECFQDPQHVYIWTEESINYFSGDYYGFHDHYGHRSRFKKIKNTVKEGRLIAEIKAIKDLEDFEPYTL
jgi:SAM-dependent methyltransferase